MVTGHFRKFSFIFNKVLSSNNTVINFLITSNKSHYKKTVKYLENIYVSF
ncbi:hypothetical protein ADIARSV_1499 [Arcticibacter svalbardensis MN12-7]|uniref:Uncharacterized protein n=1 Tax=Arcticibacter svalbardensis MN12-7 TaxID=1150600 RepID=R9H285_9SPHI|nr:hypothetical protein ADIARSV_1499 [Arcticibacter svalbardensis MN12-7]